MPNSAYFDQTKILLVSSKAIIEHTSRTKVFNWCVKQKTFPSSVLFADLYRYIEH